jgi:hypothetical protein
MTKHVRIENADTSDHKILIQVWEKQHVPEGQPPMPDVLIKEERADYPTAMVTQMIHSTRYLVIKERA